ncbi:MAG: LysR family transcriptional regulator substrate-binding protein, partial [Actinobacteria bacterium]|nr:LysR family transcriptional regulator substrate-binding protein [Actinomycetota bacterium]
VAFEAGQFSMAAGLVRHGLGVAFLPASATDGFPDLAAVAVTPEPLSWPVSVAVPSGRRPGAAARAFLTELQHPAAHQAG